MSSGSARKLSPFAGFGIGVGFGFGCGLGVGTGIGGEGLPQVNLPGFGFGGGCGLGFGAGWGFFAFGVGVVVRGMADLTGKTQRQLKDMAKKVALEREAGIRPPRRSQALQESGVDPLLDRIIRHVETRRKMRALSVQPR